MDKVEFIRKIMDQTGIVNENDAEKVTGIILGVLSNRLVPGEADDVEAQLPKGIKDLWRTKILSRQLSYKNIDDLINVVRAEFMRNDVALEAEPIIKAVFHTLKEQVGAGETQDMIDQLPTEVKEYFKAA